MECLSHHERELLYRMTKESGEMWRGLVDQTQPESQVVICKNPERAFYLTWAGNVEGNVNGWLVEIRPLKMGDAREFFAAFGSYYYQWIGATLQNNPFKLRAYIKNGRKKDWTISVEPCA